MGAILCRQKLPNCYKTTIDKKVLRWYNYFPQYRQICIWMYIKQIYLTLRRTIYFSPKSLITYQAICQEVFVYTILGILRRLFKYPRRAGRARVYKQPLIHISPSIIYNTRHYEGLFIFPKI